MKREGGRKWKVFEERLIELKTRQDQLRATVRELRDSVVVLSEEHRRGMKVVTDCFKTLFIGPARNKIMFGLLGSVHQQPQQ